VSSLLAALQKREIQSVLFWCTVIWLGVAGGNIYLLPLINPDQLQNSSLTGIYFFGGAALAAVYYKSHELFPHHGKLMHQVLPAAFFTLLLFVVIYFLNLYFPISAETQKRIADSGFFFPLFRPDTFLAKFGDITFQQIVCYGVLKKLKASGLTNKETLAIFMLGFFLIHLPLVFSLKWYAFFFIVPSIAAGGIFGYLILNMRYGFFKSYAVHFLFYLAVGLYLRM